MTNPTFSNSLRASLIAAAAICTMSVATAPSAQAHRFHHFHGHRLGLSINIGGGHSGIYIVRNCRWLYRNAVSTGSAYWWDRYESCRYGY